MLLIDLDLNKLSKLASQQIDHVTCIECCKYYTVPTTADCGHSLCHSCWRGRRVCASCGKSIEKKNLKLNIPLQNLTEHISSLSKTLEDLFNIKLDEYLLDSPTENQDEPNKNVKEWLASSQNQFSAPITNSTQSTQGQMEAEKVTSDIHVHSVNKRISNHKEVIHIPLQQDDWDNIEEMPETDKNTNKNQENVVGPMDIEPFEFMMDDEYNANNLRRSLRNKDNKSPNIDLKQDVQQDKTNSLDTKKTSEKSGLKVAKNWNNVKRMKKEFSKLNKKHRNKLNVSIEMCKKNINKIVPPITQENLYTIDDNTPQIVNNEKDDELINNCDVNKKMILQVTSSDSVKNNITNSVTGHKIINENNELPPPKVAFVKKSALIYKAQEINDIKIPTDRHSTGVAVNNDDIEITIKIGNTLTNICIKKKDNDVQLKINSDREVQTSLENDNKNKNDISSSKITINNMENTVHCENIHKTNTVSKINSVNKTVSKKNTASADTSTAQFEITKSIGEEMMKSLNTNQESIKKTPCRNVLQENSSQVVLNKITEIQEEADMDIFDTDSIKEANVAPMKSAKNTSSAILPSFRTSKTKTPKSDKRNRETDFGENLPSNKKRKISPYKEIQATNEMRDKDRSMEHDHVNDEAFCQMLDHMNTMEDVKNNMKKINKSQTIKPFDKSPSQISVINNSFDNKTSKYKHIEKYSENVFSMLDNESQILKTLNYKTQQSQCSKDSDGEKVINNQKGNADLDVMELCTPVADEDSDKSVVEDTPQKTPSFSKIRNKNESTVNSNNVTMKENIKLKVQNRQTDIEADIISLSDTVGESTKNITVLETLPRPTLETPITITKFVDQIKHKSTPVARKSLKFNNENSEADVTMCPSSFVLAKTTQEKEFLSKAFEQTIDSECVRHNERCLKYCIAGSCLTASEQSNVKILCSKRNWTYVEKYTKELTHLVVGVDEENKAQRSVKFMCAIAGGKWIISYEWIEKCLQVNGVVDEEQFEALDATGEPGPRRSRLAKQKLFTGISFYCMPPFRVLDVDTLKDILQCSGGRVVVEARDVRASSTPSLLLAEPEHTQEDRFIYLAMELSVVPINYEWVLNCLGSYSLESIYELLLCPASLLPPVVAKWPPELISHDVE
ncbi:LOW QUALITY PROTEIN: uncharacterized protein PF3D7_1120600-like [Danaus plexippus]|uniref:LOW QUALITY PROTEIN: uncharacterized protein PF3D7_1120600-like n=1 Tax=Danaus plexippus TaxID=13037 RepID=UPI002AB2B9E5|nr:LOW QUALITY PROTEIN: uncharacterized protein PF3D7_1120600-like [Danaus plexippus]